MFAQQSNWKDRMLRQFNNWQKQRQNLKVDFSISFNKDVKLEIIAPSQNSNKYSNI